VRQRRRAMTQRAAARQRHGCSGITRRMGAVMAATVLAKRAPFGEQ
jgi:hypothetical protein